MRYKEVRQKHLPSEADMARQAPGQRLFLFRAAAGTPTGGRLAALADRIEADVTSASTRLPVTPSADSER